jgi:uncharacterized phage protein (TIGR01671 family)
MNRFKCPACGGNQYTSADTAEGCIYCGHQELERMDTLEPEGGEGMREIKFRGKRLDNGEWVYGAFVPDALETPDNDLTTWGFIRRFNRDIGKMETIEVARESVGQYTGLCDKNGKEIYEGDILRFDDTGEEGYEYKEGFDFINMAVVIWHAGRFELDNFASTNSGVLDEMNHCQEDFIFVFSGAEVIGNIYENPDLIEGGAD